MYLLSETSLLQSENVLTLNSRREKVEARWQVYYCVPFTAKETMEKLTAK